jgi:hypothetical protein
LSDIYRERIPFLEAISHPKLFKPAWDMLSLPQQVIVRSFYGLPLESQEELDLWSIFHGGADFDELGYVTRIHTQIPYIPQEYKILTGILGRRWGKSDRINGLIAGYEITLGGHTQYVREGQDVFWLYIAQDLTTAQTNMKFVTAAVKTSPWLSKQIDGEPGIERVLFKNGIKLQAEPPNIKTSRGSAVVGVTMDEFGFWYKDAKSANPDYEVVRAIRYAQLQFPNSKQVRLSNQRGQAEMRFM